MQSIGVKKFFLDYVVASGLMILLLVLIIRNMTLWDERATVVLSQACSSPFPTEEVLKNMHASLRDDERCEMISPCVEWQSIRCELSMSPSDLLNGKLNGDTLVTRMRSTLVKSFGILGHEVTTVERATIGLLLLLTAYGVVLTEAVAVTFALFRQNKLKQTLTLPSGTKKDQLFKPALFAVLLAVVIVMINYLIFNLFDHPEPEGREVIKALFKSTSGILIAVTLGPLAEELLFRGVLLRFFVEKKKLILGTVLVSLLFAAVHGFHEPSLGWQLYVSSMYFIISVFLCRLYIKQKNIWSPIVFHSAYNSTLVILFLTFA